jgi:hypothetical protein
MYQKKGLLQTIAVRTSNYTQFFSIYLFSTSFITYLSFLLVFTSDASSIEEEDLLLTFYIWKLFLLAGPNFMEIIKQH